MIEPVLRPDLPVGLGSLPFPLQTEGVAGHAAYCLLTGSDPADACLDEDQGFDTHVFASILAVAATEGLAVANLSGLNASELDALMTRRFPRARQLLAIWTSPGERGADEDEIVMVRDLLLANRSTEGEDGRLLAAMIARRSMEPNHLWEDLGLRDRSELTRLLDRHFAPLAKRNTNNMKWKRFFYRMLCEDEGFSMCSTPVCSACSDFHTCFGEESGESRLAQARRASALES